MPSLLLLLLLLSSPLISSLNQEGLYLQRVKLGLSDPTHSLSSWNPRDDTPCNWSGITCDSFTHSVVAVDLSDFQLAGPFPTFICRLPSLSSLSLSNNTINASLPDDVASCSSLHSLNLSQNLLAGSIPDALSKISNLRSLDLSGNNFSGEIPTSFGGFTRLETLNLVDNLLDGTIPASLGNISSLKELQLAYNPFTRSEIPSAFGNLTKLEILWLANCNLSGQIPATVGRMTRLKNLDLSNNRLSGSIPVSLAQMKSLVQVELFNNSLSGELPLGLSNLTSLRRIDVSMNHLTGTIPDELCALQLESLNLFENRLEGPLPESVVNSPYLSELKLFNNKLSGQLPSKLGQNSPLVHLDVSYNGFSGEIPENLCAKGTLEELILIYNSFSGRIPASLGKCSSLSRIRMRNNRLSGAVPDEFWGLPNVYLLELVENSLSGSISSMISSAKNLSILMISENQFSGPIPHEIGSLSNLTELSGNDNMFSGRIPRTLMKLSLLSRLDLSENKLSGELPMGIGALKRLNELNLANNRLSGNIPSEIGSLPVLNYLDLSSNHLSGSIPLELQNLKLNLLNLSNNMLSGVLPPLYAEDIYRDSFLGNPALCNNDPGLCRHVGKGKNQGYWLLRSIFLLAIIVFVVGVIWFFFKYKEFKKSKKGIAISKWRSFHKLGFSEYEIADCLSEDKVIGSGASGKVYKAVLKNGEVVAVKKLWQGARKEDTSLDSEKDGFEAEVETLGKIRHKNIVRLWCCCNTGNCKLLVYEYMPNGSLGDLLHGSKKRFLDWPTRYKVVLDAAEGLSYLHHDCAPPIVHRDIKSNNILLDSEFGARVADFGLAKFLNAGKGSESMSVIAGSCGYIAPEYAYTLRVNEKSDIYSFGVVILELLTGRPPNDPEFGDKDLAKWVYATVDGRGLDQVIDPKLGSEYKDEIYRVLDVGLLCTSSLPIHRPSMRRVVKLLQEAATEARSTTIVKKEAKLSPYFS
ncbi:receptor-like protein kinase HSL1 [Benincasa hispida]|uniref:receptor-like protein kinase HSL1 n=1 Tax=Benincasa hispida TaxID=102211 RepID=UPI0019018365|nr:receptor-like protein kinase HSL1 [Benincasa hispida]